MGVDVTVSAPTLRRTLRRRVMAAAAVALGATAVACPANAAPDAGAPAYAVMRISVDDGSGRGWSYLTTPQTVLYSNGLAIASKVIPSDQDPAPAVPGFITKTSATAAAKVLAALDAAGMTSPATNWGVPQVNDASTTTITVQRQANANPVSVSIYALGVLGPGLTKAQISLRKSAATLVKRLRALDASLVSGKGSATAWAPSRFVYRAVLSSPNENSVIRVWPGSKPVTDAPMCVDLSTRDSAQLALVLKRLDSASRWWSQLNTYQVYLRPLLPDESGCSTFGF